jgi:flagellar motor switch protein FliN/FliY
MELEPLSAAPQIRQEARMELLDDVQVQVRIELGSARMVVQDILRLGPGSVVPLENEVADPINVYVNDRLVARGEVLVVNDNFAVRITEVLPLPRPEAGK